jgi:glycosyltransferase involved in cell wall biosynthesis
MTIIEAYSMGKPVIGSKVGGIPEILDDKKTGFLFEMRNIVELRSTIEHAFSITSKEYESLSKAARQFADEHFSEELHYIHLLKVYSDAINHFNRYAEK